MSYWLIKSDAEAYGIEDFKKDKRTAWTGVRNYQARNFMKDMKKGELCLFYHSGMAGKSTVPTGIYGVARVVAEAHPDETQFDPKSRHFEPRSLVKVKTAAESVGSAKSVKNIGKEKIERKTVWECVDVEFAEEFEKPIPLSYIKLDPALEGMGIRKQGNRLSVQPVSEKHFKHIMKLAALNR